MKSKKLRLLALPLIASMAGAAGIVTGTLAYFTSTDKASVSIEAGQVKVSMALPADDLHIYSLGVEQTDTGTVGEKTVTYFENHGYAYMEGNVLTLDRITPGDKVAFKVKVTNESNVDIKYKFTVNYSDEVAGRDRVDDQQNPIYVPTASDIAENPNVGRGYLSDGLVVTSTLAGGYNDLLNGAQPADSVITLELPKEAGNEYQAAVAKVTIGVIAYQKNAEVYSEKFVADANAVLAASSAVNPTMHGAVTELAAANIDVVGFGTHHVYEDGDFLVWNQDTDQLKLANVFTAPNYKDWKIVDTLDEIPGLKYSAYLAGITATGDLVTNYGFDAGANTALSKVEYRGLDTARTIHIRTASEGTSVDIHGYVDPTDSTVGDIVNHYGDAGLLQIFKVANASYHEYGTAKYLIVEEGHVVVEENAVVETIDVTNATGVVSVEKDETATVMAVYAPASDPNVTIAENVTSEAVQPLEVYTFAELQDACKADANGSSHIKVMADFDVSGTTEASQLGIYRDVIIDGNGHELLTSATRAIRVRYDGFNVTIRSLDIVGKNNKMERGFQVDSNIAGSVVLDDISITNCTYYAINFCSGTTVDATVRNSYAEGYGAFNAWGDKTKAMLVGSTFVGINNVTYNAEGWNDFATIIVEGDTTGATTEAAVATNIYMEDCIIEAIQTTGNHQWCLLFNNPSAYNNMYVVNCDFVIEPATGLYLNDGEHNNLYIDGVLQPVVAE